MALLKISSFLCWIVILTEITALKGLEVTDKVALPCVACRVRLDVSSKDIKIVSFEDIARAQDHSIDEEDTAINTSHKLKNDSLKEHIIKNRIKAMKIAKEIEREKKKQKQMKKEKKTTEDNKFSGETYFKFINHLNSIKNAAAEVAATKPKTGNVKKTEDPIKETLEITIEEEDLIKRVSNNKPNVDKDILLNNNEEERDTTDENDLLPNVKYETYPKLNKKSPSRTIPDSKFVTTTRRTTRYNTEIPVSMQKRKYKKYNSKDEKTKIIKKVTNIDRQKKFNKTAKINPEVRALPQKVLWQATSVSNESSLET